MERRFLLDVVIGQGTTVLELLTGEDEALLVGRDTFLILDFGLDVLDRVGRFDFERDRLAGEGLDEDLHAAAQSQHQMERRFLLDVVIGERAAVFELFASENQALLVGRDTLLVLNFSFYVFDSIGAFDFQRNRLAGECLDEDLHFV